MNEGIQNKVHVLMGIFNFNQIISSNKITLKALIMTNSEHPPQIMLP